MLSRARAIFRKDRDYVVKDGEVIIVDEFPDVSCLAAATAMVYIRL